MELKVHCDCGQKYKFDVEPVNGQMPFTVACPICKRDGTAKANVMLQQMSVFTRVDSPPAVETAAASAPPPVMPSTMPPPPPVPPAAARLRINVAAPAEAPAASAAIPPPMGTAMAAPPPPIGARPRLGAAAPAAVAPGKEPSFGLGLLGAFVGALIGSIIYYFIFKTTGLRMFLALGVGALTGIGANVLGRGEGSKELGGVAAVFVVVGVLAAQYFVILGLWNRVKAVVEDGGYTMRVEQAKEVVKAIPTGSDAEIRMYLAREGADEGEVAKPASVPDSAVKEFKERDLPEYQDLASGKLTRDQYLAKVGRTASRAKRSEKDDEDTFKSFFMLYSLNMWSIISLAIGAGLAFKLSTNARGG